MIKKIIAGVFLVLLLIGTCGLVYADGKTVVIGLSEEPTDLNPIRSAGNAVFYDVIKVFNGLIKSDNNLEMIGDLASSWEQPDPTTIIFHLRDGVKWHDGTEFTADDVKFTYDLMTSGENVAVFPTSGEYSIISSVDVVDKKTVKFTLKEASVPFMEWLALPILPKHILAGQDLSSTEFWQKPVGTGPYVFDSWNKGEEIIFKANPNYFGDKPKIETVRYIILPDENSRINLLKSGDVQAIKILPKSSKALEGQAGVKIISNPSANWYGINLPYILPQFKDTAVHQAIAYALNKKLMVDTIFAGHAVPAYGPYRKESWVYNPAIEFNQDVEKAKKLLDDAGWKPGKDGIREKDGVKLEFELLYVATSEERKDLAVAVASDLEKIGIRAIPTSKANWDELNQNVFHNNAVIMAFGSPFDPDNNNYQIYHSSYIGNGWNNPAGYSNPEVDRLLEQGRTTSDREERKKIYGQYQKILSEDQPTPQILFSNYVFAVSDKLTGLVPRMGPHGSMGGINGELWWNIEEWDIRS